VSKLSPGPHSLVVDGTRLAYHVAGHGPVMIAHSGGPGVEATYLRMSRLEKHFTMVYLEPVGTGESGPLPADATYVGTYADFLAATVEYLGVARVYLLGHSHGGFVAQRYAVDHPDRVAGLVLYSTSPVNSPEFWAPALELVAAYPQRYPDVPEAADVVSAWSMDLGGTEESVTALLRAVTPIYFADFFGRRAEFEPLRSAMRCWPTPFQDMSLDFRTELSSVTAPTLVIAGRHDFLCGPAWAQLLHEGIGRSRLVIFEESGHFAHVEEPDAFADAVTELQRGVG